MIADTMTKALAESKFEKWHVLKPKSAGMQAWRRSPTSAQWSKAMCALCSGHTNVVLRATPANWLMDSRPHEIAPKETRGSVPSNEHEVRKLADILGNATQLLLLRVESQAVEHIEGLKQQKGCETSNTHIHQGNNDAHQANSILCTVLMASLLLLSCLFCLFIDTYKLLDQWWLQLFCSPGHISSRCHPHGSAPRCPKLQDVRFTDNIQSMKYL
eukprot:1151781-Pelagomonas_calceolata.AAC.3